ncbi:MAG: nitrogenase-stabilizing/protective protein NifW [Oscillatoriales cyanobacterium RM2_1_1]|nr:nitrogenase-stabilizing/protective protein NifW [Oscillatoriales cyanobacterium SM2_3_0]NJO45444.1 nitrogenase-stabilizing/protective protein NifW [Oscillatoriales cyanobacterium RM2_1_1]
MTITQATPRTLTIFKKLTDAEDYLQFFAIPYDQDFVNINRLHILKYFSKLLQEVDAAFPDVTDEELLSKYHMALEEAYEVFKTSSPLKTKLFKVFQQKQSNVVTVTDLLSNQAKPVNS